MEQDPATGWENDELTEEISGCIIRVHQTLGPGILESIYRNALIIELRKPGLEVEQEKEISVTFDETEVGLHRFDLVVEQEVILELKAVEEFCRAHYAKLRSYLRAAGLHKGLLVNFSKPMAEWRRVFL